MSQARVDWTSPMTFAVLASYECIKADLSHGNLRKVDYKNLTKELNDLWGSHTVSMQAVKYKIENIKRKYKEEVTKLSATGGVPSHWEFFDRFHEISAKEHRYAGITGGIDDGEYRNPLPRHVTPGHVHSPPEIPVVDYATVEAPPIIDLESQEAEPVVTNQPEPVVTNQHEPEITNQHAQTPRSPRTRMCDRPGVSGQKNKRRKTRSEDNAELVSQFSGMVTSMMNAWKGIEAEKLTLLREVIGRQR